MPSELWYRPRRCAGARSAMNAAELGEPNISPMLQTATAIAIPIPDVRIPNPPNPSPVRRTPSAIIRIRGWRIAIAVTPSSKIDDEDPVRTLQEPVDPVGEPEVADPQGEGGVPLRVDEPARQDRGEDEEEALVGEDRGTRAAALPILLPSWCGCHGGARRARSRRTPRRSRRLR